MRLSENSYGVMLLRMMEVVVDLIALCSFKEEIFKIQYNLRVPMKTRATETAGSSLIELSIGIVQLTYSKIECARTWNGS